MIFDLIIHGIARAISSRIENGSRVGAAKGALSGATLGLGLCLMVSASRELQATLPLLLIYVISGSMIGAVIGAGGRTRASRHGDQEHPLILRAKRKAGDTQSVQSEK